MLSRDDCPSGRAIIRRPGLIERRLCEGDRTCGDRWMLRPGTRSCLIAAMGFGFWFKVSAIALAVAIASVIVLLLITSAFVAWGVFAACSRSRSS